MLKMDTSQSAIGAHMVTNTRAISKGRFRTGWTISGLVAAFMFFDVVGKFAKPAPVIAAFARTGWPIELAVPIGAILLICTVLFMIPRTSALGAILLTGYLGGALATNLRLQPAVYKYALPGLFWCADLDRHLAEGAEARSGVPHPKKYSVVDDSVSIFVAKTRSQLPC